MASASLILWYAHCSNLLSNLLGNFLKPNPECFEENQQMNNTRQTIDLHEHFDALAAFPVAPAHYVRPIQASMPFSQAAEAFLASRTTPIALSQLRYVSKNTFKDYVKKLKALKVFFGDVPLDRLHAGLLVKYQQRRAEGIGFTRKIGKTIVQSPAGAAKINAELSLLQRILKLGGAWTADHEAFYVRFKVQESEMVRALSQEEQDSFMLVAQSRPEYYPIWWYSLVAVHLTFSSDEMRTIRIGDINLAYQIISVNRQIGKNSYRRRDVPFNDGACGWALERLIERARKMGATEPQHYLFPGRLVRNVFDPSTHMSETGLRKPFEAVRAAAGVPWFQLNGWRHTAITRMAEAGISIATIMRRAGHVTLRMSAHYTHISEQAERFAITRAVEKKPTISLQAAQLRRQLTGY
jgi:integrase